MSEVQNAEECLRAGRLSLFNSEHDICLANGSSSFVAPLVAQQFSNDCVGIMDFVLPDVSKHKVWGWDSVVCKQLAALGAKEEELPSASYLEQVRKLSHRRYAKLCKEFVFGRFPNPELLCDIEPAELPQLDSIVQTVNAYADAILKAPWSGSGRGIRKIRADEFTQSDLGWCRKVLQKQGSIMVERRQKLALDFSLQFFVGADAVHFEGFAIFEAQNCSYTSNLLASNEHILKLLSKYIPENKILEIKDLTAQYLSSAFLGNYRGVLGVDMFVTEDGRVAPCIEINVRNNMGMVSRRVYEQLKNTIPDGQCTMRVVNAKSHDALMQKLKNSRLLLTDPGEKALYAIAVY